MRHQPFVQALTDCGGAHRPEWAALCAGFLVLRHFDDWLVVGPARTGEDRDATIRVRQQIDAIPDSAQEVRYLLGTALDVLDQAEPTDVVGAVGPLLAYGSYLEQAKQQYLGQHVLSVVTEVLDSPGGAEDLRSVAGAYLHLGRVAHKAGDFDGAETCYLRVLTLAELAGDDAMALYAKASIGMVWNSLGNLANAEALFDMVVTAARTHQLSIVEAYALRGRGGTLQMSGRLGYAIRDLSAAYSLTPDQSIREIVLGDLAVCVYELGLWQAASAIHGKLARTARSAMARAVALINLLEGAVMQGDQEKYQTYWQELLAHHIGPLPTELNMYAEYYAAQGVERFQSPNDAISAYRTVVTRANEIGTNRVACMAQERLDILQKADW